MSDETWDEKIARLRGHKPAETSLTMPDPAAVDEIRVSLVKLQEVRETARKAAPADLASDVDQLAAWIDARKPVKAALKALHDAQDRAADLEVTFTFRRLPPDVYDALPAAHPPTEAQRETRGLQFDPETYIPALAAASSVDGVTADQWTALLRSDDDGAAPFNQGDRFALLDQLRTLNERPSLMLGKGSRSTPN